MKYTFNKKRVGLSSFSGTDLSTNVNSPGICFPFGPIGTNDVQHKPSFSSIMLHDGSNNVIGRTEYRTATSPNETTVEYKKHKSLTFVFDQPTIPNSIAAFFGEEPIDNKYIFGDKVSEEQLLSTDISSIIFIGLRNSSYLPETKYIQSDNISEKTFGMSFAHKLYKSKQNTKDEHIKTPSRNSKEWKTIALEIHDFFGVELLPYNSLIAMSSRDRASYYEELHESYYGEEIKIDNKSLLPMNIINLQDKIWKEFNLDHQRLKDENIGLFAGLFNEDEINSDDVSGEEMCDDLRVWGIDPDIIANASLEQIKSIWTKAVNS